MLACAICLGLNGVQTICPSFIAWSICILLYIPTDFPQLINIVRNNLKLFKFRHLLQRAKTRCSVSLFKLTFFYIFQNLFSAY